MASTNAYLPRALDLDLKGHNAAFLWGPRQSGKTTLLKARFPSAIRYDLLDTGLKTRLLLRSSLLREEVLASKPPLVVIDEVQKVPDLLDEVHWCLENTATKFILCGSSARKLRKGAATLLGGRAWRFELHPLVSVELPDIDLERALNHGLLPRHYLQEEPERSLSGYVLDYLEEEIRAEGLARDILPFGRFLDAAAIGSGQLLNHSNVARDCGVSSKTVKEYYHILEDTLLGHRLEPWRKRRKRRLIETAKFYLFDPGIVRILKRLRLVQPGTEEFGLAFEQFLVEEVRAFLSYRNLRFPMFFYRTSTGLEVDLIVGDMELAAEFKATPAADERHAKGLDALRSEHKVRRAFIVSLDPAPRRLATGVDILPWRMFLKRLWAGDLI